MISGPIWYTKNAMEKKLIDKINMVLPHLDERLRRLYLASEAEALGKGGAKEISEVFGIHQNTLTAGKKDLLSGEVLSTDDGEFYRTRRKGGGRKRILDKSPEILETLDNLVDGNSFGNPENPLRWTTKSLRNLADELETKGFHVSHATVGTLLEHMSYSLQINQKMNQVGKASPDRDEQFKHINATVIAYTDENEPVISVDCKKKENVGNFYNKGAEYAKKGTPTRVMDHDFPLHEKGKAVPYGVYDIINNEGYVNLGISSETAQFAVHSIRIWWNQMGKIRFPYAHKIYITADGGGSNGSRCKLWKAELQVLANEFGFPIEVSHFPPGTSKWNKIEHRLFSQISKNWRGRPLESLAVIVNLISSTSTQTGLLVNCGIDTAEYKTGIKVEDGVMEGLNIVQNDFHGDWNYTISPIK